MKVIVGADHRGYELKELIKADLYSKGIEVTDVGASEYNPSDDYVDFALAGVEAWDREKDAKIILLCGSGHGVEIVANRHLGIRAILGYNVEVVKQGREHEDANVLVLPADYTSEAEARERVEVFLTTEFSGEERHTRRLKKLAEVGGA